MSMAVLSTVSTPQAPAILKFALFHLISKDAVLARGERIMTRHELKYALGFCFTNSAPSQPMPLIHSSSKPCLN